MDIITYQLITISNFVLTKDLDRTQAISLSLMYIEQNFSKLLSLIRNRIPYLWNNLPDNIRISNLGISSFKKQCEDYYKNIGFDPDNPRATWVS